MYTAALCLPKHTFHNYSPQNYVFCFWKPITSLLHSFRIIDPYCRRANRVQHSSILILYSGRGLDHRDADPAALAVVVLTHHVAILEAVTITAEAIVGPVRR